jgi:lipid A 4'-phosphatase
MKQNVAQDPAVQGTGRWRIFAWASFVGLTAAFIFVGFPQIDFAVTNLFYGGNRAFIFNFPGVGKDLRVFFKFVFYAASALVIAGLLYSALTKRTFLTMGFQKWFYLVACLALGPGLTANVILKDNWGRARPFHVQEYGGEQRFTPALARSDQCEDNCSFVSGEASSIYMVFFALALLARRRRARLIGLGVLAGTLAGLVRIAQGGHFLSDVIFAGVLMALIAELLHWLVFEFASTTLSDDGPVHTRLATMASSSALAARGLAGSGRQAPQETSKTSPSDRQDP